MYLRYLSLSLLCIIFSSKTINAAETDTKKAFDVQGQISIVSGEALTFGQLRQQSRHSAQDLIKAFGSLDDNDLCVHVHYSSAECLNWIGSSKHPVLGYSLQTNVLPAKLLYLRDKKENFGTAIEGDTLMIALPGTESQNGSCKRAELTCSSRSSYYPWHIALRYELKRFAEKADKKILEKEIADLEEKWEKKKEALKRALLETKEKQS